MLEFIISHIGLFSIASLVLGVAVPVGGHAERKSEAGWQILLCTEDKSDGKHAEPFTLRFNEKVGQGPTWE
jgi:hypothetical protein